MDIEEQFRANPLIATAFLLSCTLGASLLIAFFMQWHPWVLAERSYQNFKRERKEKGSILSGLKWAFLGDFIEGWKVWKESRGNRFVLPLGIAFSLLAWLLYEYMIKQ